MNKEIGSVLIATNNKLTLNYNFEKIQAKKRLVFLLVVLREQMKTIMNLLSTCFKI